MNIRMAKKIAPLFFKAMIKSLKGSWRKSEVGTTNYKRERLFIWNHSSSNMEMELSIRIKK